MPIEDMAYLVPPECSDDVTEPRLEIYHFSPTSYWKKQGTWKALKQPFEYHELAAQKHAYMLSISWFQAVGKTQLKLHPNNKAVGLTRDSKNDLRDRKKDVNTFSELHRIGAFISTLILFA